VRSFAFLAVGIVLILLQANVHRFLGPVFALLPAGLEVYADGFAPNLVLPLIVFLGVHEPSMPRGAFLAFGLGYLVDVLGAAPIGLFTFVFVALWWLARVAGVRLTAQTWIPRMSLAFGFALIEGAMVLVLLAIFGSDTRRPVEILSFVLPRAAATAIAAPLVFRLAQRLHAGSAARGASEGAPAT
jgi:rod shape-determining protein MreD